ncbi:glycosyltransferase family 4 protein [Candidatus Gottesmanbacteria bacterium]|nr:glycosyltransferase family 4 protein [Candidatus Gottesmanbacteria bacterium]
MKIGVDAGCLGIPDERLKVGVYQMAVGLLRALGKIDKKNNYILYSFIPINKYLLKSFGNNFYNKVIKPSFLWSSIWLPLAVNLDNLDVFIGLSQNLPMLSQSTKSFVIVHDLTFEKYPSFFPDSYNQLHRITQYSIKSADKVIAVSNATKTDIVKYYPNAINKTQVIYSGFEDRFNAKGVNISKELLKMRINKPFFLFVGTYKQSKNIPNLIKAFTLFSSKDNKYNLVIVGSNFWMDKSILKAIDESSYKKRIKMLGFVSDKDLHTLYKSAAAFVSPAFNEGFGLTYLEAALFKLPIIASKTGSIFEIFQNSVLYSQPSNIKSIASAMDKIAKDKILRKKLAGSAYIKSKSFRWEKSARELLKVISTSEQ